MIPLPYLESKYGASYWKKAPSFSKPDLQALADSALVEVKDVDTLGHGAMICERVLIPWALCDFFLRDFTGFSPPRMRFSL